MTTQRERLAGVLAETTWQLDYPDGRATTLTLTADLLGGMADALLARGVRVINEETLPPPMWRQRMLDVLDGNGPVTSVLRKIKDGTWL